MRALLPVLCLSVVAAGCSADAVTSPASPSTVTVPVVVTSAHAPVDTPHNLGAHLSGRNEVPEPLTTRAEGQAIFQLSPDGTSMSYRLLVANIDNITQSHIHMAAADAIGPVVVWLYPAASPPVLIPGRSQGTLAEGVLTDASVIGALAGQGLEGLLDAMRAGNTYVNVHTSAYPGGEMRGQVR